MFKKNLFLVFLLMTGLMLGLGCGDTSPRRDQQKDPVNTDPASLDPANNSGGTPVLLDAKEIRKHLNRALLDPLGEARLAMAVTDRKPMPAWWADWVRTVERKRKSGLFYLPDLGLVGSAEDLLPQISGQDFDGLVLITVESKQSFTDPWTLHVSYHHLGGTPERSWKTSFRVESYGATPGQDFWKPEDLALDGQTSPQDGALDKRGNLVVWTDQGLFQVKGDHVSGLRRAPVGSTFAGGLLFADGGNLHAFFQNDSGIGWTRTADGAVQDSAEQLPLPEDISRFYYAKASRNAGQMVWLSTLGDALLNFHDLAVVRFPYGGVRLVFRDPQNRLMVLRGDIMGLMPVPNLEVVGGMSVSEQTLGLICRVQGKTRAALLSMENQQEAAPDWLPPFPEGFNAKAIAINEKYIDALGEQDGRPARLRGRR